MTSMKAYLEQLALHMGSYTPAALYERQRALVRLRLLSAPKRVGRGFGIRATPETVSVLLLACLATDNLSEVTAAGVSRIARLHSRGTGICQLTKANTFGDALRLILADPALAAQVLSITYNRSESTVDLSFTAKGGRVTHSAFGGEPGRPLFEVWALLGGRLLKTIADDLKEDSNG